MHITTKQKVEYRFCPAKDFILTVTRIVIHRAEPARGRAANACLIYKLEPVVPWYLISDQPKIKMKSNRAWLVYQTFR